MNITFILEAGATHQIAPPGAGLRSLACLARMRIAAGEARPAQRPPARRPSLCRAARPPAHPRRPTAPPPERASPPARLHHGPTPKLSSLPSVLHCRILSLWLHCAKLQPASGPSRNPGECMLVSAAYRAAKKPGSPDSNKVGRQRKDRPSRSSITAMPGAFCARACEAPRAKGTDALSEPR